MQKKTLFDHIKQITSNSDSEYFDSLSDEDVKTYNVYMIHRFLSMNENWIEVVNEIQKYTQQLKQRGTHKVYDEIIPKGKIFLKYIKAKEEKKYNHDVINILKRHYELGEVQVKQYYDIYMKTPEGIAQLLEIVRMHGLQEKDYKRIEKELYGGK